MSLDKAVMCLLKRKHPSRCHSSKQQNEIVSNLEEPDEINGSTAINLQPYHPKPGERQQQMQFFAITLKKPKIYLFGRQ